MSLEQVTGIAMVFSWFFLFFRFARFIGIFRCSVFRSFSQTFRVNNILSPFYSPNSLMISQLPE